MKRAIACGIDTVEELERVEHEEAEELATVGASATTSAVLSTPPLLDANFVSLWDSVYPEVQLQPSLISDFGLLARSLSFVDGLSRQVGQGSSGRTPSASQSSGGS